MKIKSGSTKAPFETYFVSFAHGNNDSKMYIIGNSKSQQMKFSQLLCESIENKDNNSDNSKKNSIEYCEFESERASLGAIGMDSGKNILTFTLTDMKYGECIVIIDDKKCYNVFSIDKNKWIATKLKALKPETSHACAVVVPVPMKQS